MRVGSEPCLLAVPGAMTPGLEPGEQGGHGRHGPARCRSCPFDEIRLLGEGIEIGGQAAGASQGSDDISAQGVDRDEQDRAAEGLGEDLERGRPEAPRARLDGTSREADDCEQGGREGLPGGCSKMNWRTRWGASWTFNITYFGRWPRWPRSLRRVRLTRRGKRCQDSGILDLPAIPLDERLILPTRS